MTHQELYQELLNPKSDLVYPLIIIMKVKIILIIGVI